MNSGEKIYKAMFPILSGHKYFYWQMLCDGNQYGKFEPELVSSTDRLEVTFDDEAECKEFFEKVKELRAKIPTPDPNATSSKSNKTLATSLAVVNDSGAEILYLKKQGSGNAEKINKGQQKVFIGVKVGDKFYYSNDKGQEVNVAFVVQEYMLIKKSGSNTYSKISFNTLKRLDNDH
ncbi:MAG: hypothetical protein ACK4ON_04500 [Bacteroidia bacterium]